MILTGAELSKYFGKETTPREMKDQIIKLLDDCGRASRRNTKSRRRKPRRRNKRDFGPCWPEDTRPVGLCPTPRRLWRYKIIPRRQLFRSIAGKISQGQSRRRRCRRHP